MKVFALRDSEYKNMDLAYLFYYKKSKKFFFELPKHVDPWQLPLLLSSFAARKIYTVDAERSRLWVQQRIVPPDRQNIGHILKEYKLKEYDEFKLLMIDSGTCAQDSYYLKRIREDDCLAEIRKRREKRIADILALDDCRMLIFFKNGRTKKYDFRRILQNDVRFAPILREKGLFRRAEVQPGGYGIQWGTNLGIMYPELYKMGKYIDIQLQDILHFIDCRVVDTIEAMQILNCTRQGIGAFIDKGKLAPIKSGKKSRLFLKSAVVQVAE